MPADPDSPRLALAPPDVPESGGVPCDFCGHIVESVRRVALDGDYERLRTRHQVRYSCSACFDEKEQVRREGDH